MKQTGLNIALASRRRWTRREIALIRLRAKWDRHVLFGWRVWSWIDWLVVRRPCGALSPEDLECVRRVGHEGLHVPKEGKGWAWG